MHSPHAVKAFSSWTPLTGEDNRKWYIPNLDSGKRGKALKEQLDRETEWAKDFIRKRYSALKLYKLGALKSGPGAPSHFEEHGALHSDYDAFVNKR